MRVQSWVWAAVHTALCVLLLSSTARAKSYKSGELETKTRYGFGAFEARIRCAQGPGAVSTFFLWKPGSEQSPSVPWHEIDFEMGLAASDYQTQIMTPGSSPPLYRTEHAQPHNLPVRVHQAYFTYRIEWTPDYIAFFVDGQEVRRETDKTEYSTLFATDSNGDTPINERMELRTGVWPADANIYAWAGIFDGSSVPTGHFVDYVKVWDYTPNQPNEFATLLLDEQFDSLDTNAWYPAQWTFEFSASDYVSQNVGTKDGRLVVALTTEAGAGSLPTPPPDVPPTIPTPPVSDGFVLEAESPTAYYDTSPGNLGSAACGTTDLDAEPTSDPTGGTCDVGWAEAGEWLEYAFTLDKDDEFVITLRIASDSAGTFLHLEIDGTDVSGPVQGPGSGWQSFVDAVVPGIVLSAGPHTARLVFDTGYTNVNYLTFERVSSPPDDPPPNDPCAMSCDDGNPCTDDMCDSETGCHFLNNTFACADDGNACTNDVCSAGVCTHPTNGTCSSSAEPCAGLCNQPVIFGNSNYNSGNIGTGAGCYQTTANLHGGVCGNFASGRKLTVNGVQLSCAGNWPSPLPAKRNGGYCVQTTPGNYAWAYFATW